MEKAWSKRYTSTNNSKKLLYIIKIENLINSYLIKKNIYIPSLLIRFITKIIEYFFLNKKSYKDTSSLNFVELNKFDNKVKFFLKNNLKKNKLFLCRDKLWFKMNYAKKGGKKSFLFLILKKKEIVGLIGLIENNNHNINLKRLEIADFIFNEKKRFIHWGYIKKDDIG